MAQTRRSFLNSALALLLAGGAGRAWPNSPSPLDLAISLEAGGRQPAASGEVTLTAPDIAEDGALVPVTVESTLPGVEAVWIFVEKNPTPLAARFHLDHALDAFVSLRVKMNESCELIALVKSGDEYFIASKPVRVLAGGCG